jgi:hypothetical protein
MCKITYKPTKYRIKSEPTGGLAEHYFQALLEKGHRIYSDDKNKLSRCIIETNSLDRLLEDICGLFNGFVTIEYPDEQKEFECREKERETVADGMTTIHLVESKDGETIVIGSNCECVMTMTTE